MVTLTEPYPARLDIGYPEKLDRFTTFFRLIWIVPIAIILSLHTATGNATITTESGETFTDSSTSPELTCFGTRVGAYLALLSDLYSSLVDEQAVYLGIDYGRRD